MDKNLVLPYKIELLINENTSLQCPFCSDKIAINMVWRGKNEKRLTEESLTIGIVECTCKRISTKLISLEEYYE